MLYLAAFVIVLSAFLLVTNYKNRHALSLVWALLSYLFLFTATVLYFAKDSSYHDIVTQYFYLPAELWKRVFYLRIDRIWLIRLLHISDFSAIFFSFCFALGLFRESSQTKRKKLTYAIPLLLGYILICLVLFDPQFQIAAYYHLYPAYILPAEFEQWQRIIETTVRVCNVLILVFSNILMILAFSRTPRIRTLRMNYAVLGVSSILLTVLHALFFSFSPAYYLKISKFIDSYRFLSIKTAVSLEIYQFLPYFLVFMVTVMVVFILRLSRISSQLQNSDYAISRQISASETTSKVFCHYIKNELLAIQSQIEMLPVNEENKEALSLLRQRCDNLYTRMDIIHRSTRTSELHLAKADLRDIVKDTMEPFAGELKTCQYQCLLPENPMPVLADSEYLGQALHNLVRNALDAMENRPSEKRNLTLRISRVDPWVILEIKDTGCGISSQNLPQIFTPFFSSQPFSRHWGIGLTLSYKIIQAHDGKIELESEYGKGTNVRVALPCLKR